MVIEVQDLLGCFRSFKIDELEYVFEKFCIYWVLVLFRLVWYIVVVGGVYGEVFGYWGLFVVYLIFGVVVCNLFV